VADSERAYASFLGRSISASRGRLQLTQTAIAARMQQLGFTDWRQQTLARVEKGRRPLSTVELLGLAGCLGTTVQYLMSPLPQDDPMEWPSGRVLEVSEVRYLVFGAPGVDDPRSSVRGARDLRGIRWTDDNKLEDSES